MPSRKDSRLTLDLIWGSSSGALRCIPGGFPEATPTCLPDTPPSPLRRRALVERAAAEGRAILTRDRAFVGARYSDATYFVASETKQAQLAEVVSTFGLTLAPQDLLSRCAACNGELLARPLSAAELPAGHGVEAGVLMSQHEFWCCGWCRKVYWQGCMYGNAMQRLSSLVASMSLAGGSGGGASGSREPG